MRSERSLRLLPALIVAVILTGGILLYAFLLYLTTPDSAETLQSIIRENRPVVLFLLLLTAGVPAWLVYQLIQIRIGPVGRLADASTLLKQNMPPETGPPTGIPEIDRIASGLKDASELLRDQQQRLDRELKQASTRLSSERDVLSAIVNQLARGLIVTNSEAQILLFNDAAGRMLSYSELSPPVYLGLGRQLGRILDERLVSWAMQESVRRTGDEGVSFITTTAGNRLARVQVLPTTHEPTAGSGFLFFVNDVTELKSTQDQSSRFADEGIRKVRDSVAGIRSAAENLREYPDTDPKMQQRFYELILDESEKIAGIVLEHQAGHEERAKSDVALSLVSTDELFGLLRNMEGELEHQPEIGDPDEELFLHADAFTLPVGLLFLGKSIAEATGKIPELKTGKHDGYVRLSWMWKGEEILTEVAESWFEARPSVGGLQVPYPLSEIMQHHRAEWWQKTSDGGLCELSVILPMAPERPKSATPAAPEKQRAEFYDFDLFNQRADADTLKIRLDAITATVFDTETTGLNPTGGDRLISIGAIRIVNGKPDTNQQFDRLIDPGRRIPASSTAIHGITEDMVAGKPGAKKVLGDFSHFCADDPLIAHNAAFDMRFLELERANPDHFRQPVLDTLLLSTVLHPNLEGHSLDVLAERFGLETGTRHNALDDTLLTAALFVKLVPLLRSEGIVTIEDALRASRESLYARLRY
ncbi:MAG: PAS domain-containing protein [Balneolia bacterium]|nr:PAS domain-containing protein [Balneolia bacterium]